MSDFRGSLLHYCYRRGTQAKGNSEPRRRAGNATAALGEEDVADDLRLLLEPVAVERPAVPKRIGVAAERVAHQRQIEAAAGLGLPDMGHFVDEQPLAVQRLGREILRPRGRRAGWKWILPVGAIAMPPRLERPPFAPDHPDLRIIDGVAEHRSGEGDFAGGQGTGDRASRAET